MRPSPRVLLRLTALALLAVVLLFVLSRLRASGAFLQANDGSAFSYAGQRSRQFFRSVAPALFAVLVIASIIARTLGARSTIGAGPFLQANGTTFSYAGQAVSLFGSTMYPTSGPTHAGGSWTDPAFPSYIDYILSLAQSAGLNTIRPTDYLQNSATWDNPTVWANMDYLVAQAQARHMFVILDLSSYRNFLERQNRFPYDPNDWAPFDQFVGQRYVNATAVANYAIAGEIAAPNSTMPWTATAAQYVDFFSTVSSQLYTADGGHHLISIGGLSYLDWNSGIAWQQLFSLPHIAMATIHVYSSGDRDTTLPMVSSWAQANQKPFVIEEFGFQQSMGDQARAAAYSDIYQRGVRSQAVGMVLWNLGPEIAGQSYDVNQQTPATWQVVQQNAPIPPTGTPIAPTATSGAPTTTSVPPTITPVPPTTTAGAPTSTAIPQGASCPLSRSCADIGSPALAGSQALSGGSWTVQGSGGDIWDTADHFHYVWQALSGDGSISAHVILQTNTDPWAKAGVMLRGSTVPGAPFYDAMVTPGNGITVQYRPTAGANALEAIRLAGTVPAYLEVARTGSTFTAYTSSNGTTWTEVAGSSVTLSISGTVLAGLAVTSHNVGALSTVTFDTVSVT